MFECSDGAATAGTTAVILAGGLGTRVRKVIGDIPKPMFPVLGKPWLEWLIQFLAQQGIRRIAISAGFKADIIERHFSSRSDLGVDVSVVTENEPSGTAGGFLNVVRCVTGVGKPPQLWLVLNGDSLVAASLTGLYRALEESTADGAIMGVHAPDATRYGKLACDNDGWVREFCEKSLGAGVINAGIYLIRHSLIELFPGRVPLSFEFDAFPELLARGKRFLAVPVQAPFLDIGTPETLPLAEEFIRRSFGKPDGLDHAANI
jgi:NDP-sugar pyrophosphorylase family protein